MLQSEYTHDKKSASGRFRRDLEVCASSSGGPYFYRSIKKEEAGSLYSYVERLEVLRRFPEGIN